ncbi:MAG: SCP2 sterol-binding domain-containing protein, partial [Kiloniellaceae bacterium]
MSLERITARLEARKAELAGLNARVLFDLGEDGTIAVDATAAPPVIGRGTAEPDCTIRLSAENMAKLIEGALNPTLAYSLGKLKVEGSMGIAMKLAAL